jgi:hypothetical protein
MAYGDNVVGAPLWVDIDGLRLPCSADSDLQDGLPSFNLEELQTTSGAMQRVTKQTQNVTLTVRIDAKNDDALLEKVNSTQQGHSISLMYSGADGTVRSATGKVRKGARSGQTGDVAITLIPDQKQERGWERV